MWVFFLYSLPSVSLCCLNAHLAYYTDLSHFNLHPIFFSSPSFLKIPGITPLFTLVFLHTVAEQIYAYKAGSINNIFSYHSTRRILKTHLSREFITYCLSLFTIASSCWVFKFPADTKAHMARNRLAKCVSKSREDRKNRAIISVREMEENG